MMNLLVADDVGQVKVVKTSPKIDTTQKESARPSIWSFYEPSPHVTTIDMYPLPKISESQSEQVIAILRTSGVLEFATFIPRKVKVADLNGNARLPDTLWHSDLDADAGKWVGLGLEGNLLYAWSENGRVEVWGLPEGGVDAKEGEPMWTLRAAGKVEVPSGMIVSVVRVQPYNGTGVPDMLTLAVGYTTEAGEVEVFEASTAPGKKSPSTKTANLKLIPLFKSKAPKADSLKLAIPGGVTSICWLPSPIALKTTTTPQAPAGGNRYARNKPLEFTQRLFLAVGTPTGELRLYDSHLSRRAIFREEMLPRGGAAALRRGLGTNVTRAVGGAGTGAIKCLQFLNPPSQDDKLDKSDPTSLSFIFSDENAKCGIYTAKRTSSESKEWKGRAVQLLDGNISGIVRGTGVYYQFLPKDQSNGILLAIVGLDRYLRIYKATSKTGKRDVERMEMVSRAYMHTRGTHAVWVGNVDDQVWETDEGRREREREERRKEREKEVEEVWEGIEGGDLVMVDGGEVSDGEDSVENYNSDSEEENGEDDDSEEDDGDEDNDSEDDDNELDNYDEDDDDEESDQEDESESEVTPPPPRASTKKINGISHVVTTKRKVEIASILVKGGNSKKAKGRK